MVLDKDYTKAGRLNVVLAGAADLAPLKYSSVYGDIYNEGVVRCKISFWGYVSLLRMASLLKLHLPSMHASNRPIPRLHGNPSNLLK